MYMIFYGYKSEVIVISGQFTINTETNTTYMFADINGNVKITSSENTKNNT